MNDKKIASLYRQILNASQLYSVGDREWVTAEFFDISDEGVPENEVIRFGWSDEVGNEFSVKITEQGLNDSEVKDENICLIDSEGEVFEVRLYVLVRETAIVDWEK